MVSTKKIIILGTGGSAIDILDTLNELKETCVGFLDDDKTKWNKDFYGIKVLGPLKKAQSFNDCLFVNGIGNSKNFFQKETIIARTRIPLNRFISLIHPTASVSKMAKLGFGSVILQQVTVASNVSIGNHVIILPNSIISHDVSIGDYSCIAAGVSVSGGVNVGKACYLGTNSSIIDNVTIHDYVLVGMGSVVLNNVSSKTVVVGIPAKVLKEIIVDNK